MIPSHVDRDILTAIARSQLQQRPILTGITLPVEPSANPPLGDFYWSSPREVLIAEGQEITILTPPGRDRFYRIKQALKYWQESSWGNPHFIGGFSFYDYPDHSYPPSLFYVPQWLWRKVGDQVTWTVNVVIQPTSELPQIRQTIIDRYGNLQPQTLSQQKLPPVLSISEQMGQFSWAIAVQKALQLIQQGKLQKLVLARVLDIETADAIPLPLVLHRLQTNYPNCTTFCFRLLPQSHLIGASPELLLRSQFRGNRLFIETLALAGSIPTSNSPTTDHLLGVELLNSPKDLQEHQIVIRSLSQALTKMQADIAPLGAPRIMSLANVQHLCTPITASIPTADPLDIFDLMAELHPTAAMAGYPKELSLPLIQTYEPSDRGWYAAPLGWLDSQGNAEFVVSIRSALISANKARLFAGAGIIANSDIEQEIRETNAKFTPILQALGIQPFL